MTQDELMALLNAREWRDVEFKEARRAVPHSAYETVSAFANTAGGHLVFGVRQSGLDVEIVGVLDVDKVQGDFLTTLRQREKISVNVGVREELHNYEDADLLIFHVPEVHRSDKPVYLNGDIRRSFVRSGGSDVRCSDSERNRFLMDAAAERFDGQAVEFKLEDAFDADSIKWYRAMYEGRLGNRSLASLSDVDFLAEMGLVAERSDGRLPTRAAILLFGSNPRFRQLLSRPVVDCQRYRSLKEQADTGERWVDRLVLEENLIRTWRTLIDDWYSKVAEHPFQVDVMTLQRNDTPPDFLAFREAMVNMVVHQDYAEQGRKAVIRHYPDQTVFWNPGDAFATDADLLEPGEKEVRNPRLALAFRRIGVSENAGWGLRDVFRYWQQLGNVPPTITNDKRRKSFELVLAKEALFSEQQRFLQARLGVNLTEAEARTFALVCREGQTTLARVRAVTGLPSSDAVTLASGLVTQSLLREAAPEQYALAAHVSEQLEAVDQASDQVNDRHNDLVTDQAPNEQLGGQPAKAEPDLVTDQVGRPMADLVTDQVAALSDLQRRLIAVCDTPRRLTELMALASVTHRTHFRVRHLKPLIDANIVRMTNPDHPNAADQRYVLTEAGSKLRAVHLAWAQKDEVRG